MKTQNEGQVVRPVLLRVSEVARLMSISRSKAYQLVQRGTIPSVRIDNTVRVMASDLDEIIRRNYTGWHSAGDGI